MLVQSYNIFLETLHRIIKNTTGKVYSSSENYDNMRGFDPASEDDMDDNDNI